MLIGKSGLGFQHEDVVGAACSLEEDLVGGTFVILDEFLIVEEEGGVLLS